VWNYEVPPPRQIAGSGTHSVRELTDLLNATKLMEPKAQEPDAMSAMVLEAGRVATEKMLDYYRRMDIKVTPQMTLAPETEELEEPERKAKTVGQA